jgi:hypothetical protein
LAPCIIAALTLGAGWPADLAGVVTSHHRFGAELKADIAVHHGYQQNERKRQAQQRPELLGAHRSTLHLVFKRKKSWLMID